MNLSLYLKEIRQNGERSFTLEQLMATHNVSKNTALNAIYRLRKHGEIVSPARGFYIMVPPEHQPRGSIPSQELIPLLMQYLNARYYVGLLTAGMFHGATHQKSPHFQVISEKRIKLCADLQNAPIDFIHKKSLKELPLQDIVVSTGYLKVASPELVALDILNYPERAGGLNHIATVLAELVERLDASKLVSLAKHIKAEYQLQRLGYILDHIETIDEGHATKVIATIAAYVEKKGPPYLLLASEVPNEGYPKCKKWRIIENSKIESDV